MHWELTMLCYFKVIMDGQTHTQTHSLDTIVSQPLRGSTDNLFSFNYEYGQFWVFEDIL